MLLKRTLEAINHRARDALEKRLRLAVRSTVVTAALDATTALTAHVDRAVDFTNRDSVQTNADLVRECLHEIRDDADRNLNTPVPWRECLPTAILDAQQLSPTSRTGRALTPPTKPTCAQRLRRMYEQHFFGGCFMCVCVLAAPSRGARRHARGAPRRRRQH